MNAPSSKDVRRLLSSSEAQLRSILATSPDAMVVIDELGAICAFSGAAERMFNYEAQEVIGRNVAMLMPEPDNLRHDGYLSNYLGSGERKIIGVGRRVHGIRRDGSVFALHLSIGESEAGGRRLFTGFMHDLSSEETSEKHLHELQAELVHQSRIGIMATMTTALAHEINQPLAAITNYVEAAQTMLEPSLPFWDREEIVECLRMASREAVRTGEIVSRLRRFISRGELQRSIALPSDLAQQTCALAAIEAKASGAECKIEIGPGEKRILVDPIQIQQVLLNLTRNAIEAAGSAGDTIEVRIVIETNEKDVCFAVIDDGPGLAPGHVPFVAFSSTKREGMGLGLSICKTIVEAHGGTIWYEAVQPKGTAFKFTVPIAPRDFECA
ncbi:sensor histidine kinase [Qipengyuania sp. MTN3-11]|uniref:sensor histidine kinase n=1 Tax=Qipengyuania sp. MTN3-11 TaxID=3056557 RepID=UPI0036F1CC7D